MKTSAAKIRALTNRIAEKFSPERIILFGSHASGRAHSDSDVDLLVVMQCKGPGARKAAEILNTVAPEFAVDLIVRTPSEIRQRLAEHDSFLVEAVQRGKVLYEAPHT
jgi:predicted nucleotidyltransferase